MHSKIKEFNYEYYWSTVVDACFSCWWITCWLNPFKSSFILMVQSLINQLACGLEDYARQLPKTWPLQKSSQGLVSKPNRRFHEDMWITGMRFQGFFKAWAIMRLVKESTTKKIKPIKEHWASKGFTVERWKTLRLTKGLIADKHLSREDRHKPFLALANLTRDFYWPETQS